MNKVNDSAKATIARIKSKNSRSSQENDKDSVAAKTPITAASRSRTSKNSKVIDTKERKAAITAISKKLLLGEISQGLALKQLRIQILGLKQDAYASLVGVSRKTISEVENDKSNYTTEVLNKLFKPFGLKIGLMPISPSMLNSLLKEDSNNK